MLQGGNWLEESEPISITLLAHLHYSRLGEAVATVCAHL